MKFEETNPETNPNFPWVVYTSGADEDSLDDQEARCRKVARDILGITNEPAKVWRETITENDGDRPALEDMLQGAGSGEFRDLIVPSPNHLSGNVGEFVDICNRLNNAWIRVHFAEGPRSDFPDVGLLPYLRNIMDMQQREELSRRIRRGLEHSARQGRLPTGTAPFGYYYYDPNTRSRKVNETEAERVRHMFQMASDGMTSGEIARTLNREGVTAKHGKRWTKRAVTRILRRRSVVGIDCWKHIRIDTFTPPIVDKTLFDQVQEKLEGNREVPNPLSGRIRCGASGRNNPYLLFGRVRCARCHGVMVGIHSRKGLRYYRCLAEATGCKPRYISAEALEEAVWNSVVEVIKDPAWIVEDIRRETGAMTAERKQRITDYCRQMALRLDGIDLQGKKGLLAHLGIRVELENQTDGIKIRVELNLNDGGIPPATS